MVSSPQECYSICFTGSRISATVYVLQIKHVTEGE